MGLQDHLNKITEGLKDIDSKPNRQRSGSLPATSSLSHFSDELRETTSELSKLRSLSGRAIQVALNLCDDGPYHTSPLDPERIQALKGNIKENGQSAPALLRLKEGGRYEIIAGRHRKAALVELGNTNWDAVIKDIDDDTAERLTFYDNLLAPSLTDYAKYLGFSKRRESKGLTLEHLAIESGVSKTTIGRLLMFGNLPVKAIETIAQAPNKISGLVAEELAGLTAKYGERVTEAVALIVSGELMPNKASAWIVNVVPAAKLKPHETVIRKGKATYAKVVRRASQMAVIFSNPADTDEAEKFLIECLNQLAKDRK